MSKQEAYVSFIIDQLQSGAVSFERVFELFLTKFNCSRPTFSKYWKEANERHIEAQNKLQRVKDDIYIESEKEAIKRNILQKHEALEILSKIAKGVAKKVNEQIIIPTSTEQRGAIETMAKIEGWYAPTKIAETDSIGNDKPNTKIKLPDGTEIEL